jgi:hypothetical protein
MEIYTTFFLCEPAALSGGFPDWRPPLAEPVRHEVRDPFTDELMVVESRVPVWPVESEDAGRWLEPAYEVVTVEGSYDDYLEDRLPPFVRNCPHWIAQGLTDIELAPLLELVDLPVSMEQPIYAPPWYGEMLQQLPAGFLARLLSLDQQDVARRWAAAMSAPEDADSAPGQVLSDAWTASDALELLQRLIDLAKKADAAHQMYLLTEA